MPTVAIPSAAIPSTVSADVRRALAEDIGSGDVTASLIPGDVGATATVLTREDAVICGQPWFDEVFQQLEGPTTVDWRCAEGQAVPADTVVCEIRGNARILLTGERTALNFLQMLSGTATTAGHYAQAVSGTGCQVLDTRKTVPGLRDAQKYAAACGGATNHRKGLYDGVLIKENHIMAAGGIREAVVTARETAVDLPIEVEVENIDEVREALVAGADILLLDNFPLGKLEEAVSLNAELRCSPAKLEASGNVTLETIREIAQTGVDFVSVGAITKHVRAIDFSMRFRINSL
jgi:nicotinate-nucleotide pyrophosphorylase (carboxylating)